MTDFSSTETAGSSAQIRVNSTTYKNRKSGMKKILLIIGIIGIVAGVLSLLLSLFNRFAYYSLLDGSPEMYAGLRHQMIVFLVVGLVLTVAGIVCLVVRR